MPNVQQVRERALELGVYLPLGAYDRVRDQVARITPTTVSRIVDELVSRGQERLEPVQNRMRRRPVAKTSVATTDVASTTRAVRKAARGPKMPRVATPKTASELPIPNYEALTASEIVAAIRGLTQTELAKVYKYEAAHENRTTVLEAVEPRFNELPIANYDAQSAEDVISRLEGLTPEELKRIRRYESETKDRKTVIEKIDALL